MDFEDRIWNVNEDNFEEIALSVFQYQATQNPVYAEYLRNLSVEPSEIQSMDRIPYMPVEVYKYREVKTGNWVPKTYFESSGTTQHNLARHLIRSLDWYYKISAKCFEYHFGSLENYVFMALLPGYLERKHSSLVTMVHHFMQKSGNQTENAFFINEFSALKHKLDQEWKHKIPVLFGVRFALLDFAEQFSGNYPGLMIIETGGMKGRRREISSEAFIQLMEGQLKGVKTVSEYGMTELTAQAYAHESGRFMAPPFMKFSIAHPTIPGEVLNHGQRGFIRILDLSNIYTCSFLQSSDIGVLAQDGSLNILGRYDTSDARGCAMLYEQS